MRSRWACRPARRMSRSVSVSWARRSNWWTTSCRRDSVVVGRCSSRETMNWIASIVAGEGSNVVSARWGSSRRVRYPSRTQASQYSGAVRPRLGAGSDDDAAAPAGSATVPSAARSALAGTTAPGPARLPSPASSCSRCRCRPTRAIISERGRRRSPAGNTDCRIARTAGALVAASRRHVLRRRSCSYSALRAATASVRGAAWEAVSLGVVTGAESTGARLTDPRAGGPRRRPARAPARPRPAAGPRPDAPSSRGRRRPPSHRRSRGRAAPRPGPARPRARGRR